MKIIFLDMDGVINPMNEYYEHLEATKGEFGLGADRLRYVNPRCSALLNEITDKTGAKLVLSSCWRVGRDLDELQAEFIRKGITGELIGKTPRTGERRGVEIQYWLDDNPEVSQFIILDDDSDMEHLMSHLVRTDTEEGLTRKETDEAIRRLP